MYSHIRYDNLSSVDILKTTETILFFTVSTRSYCHSLVIYVANKEGPDLSFYESCLIKIYRMLSSFTYIDSKLFDGSKYPPNPQNDKIQFTLLVWESQKQNRVGGRRQLAIPSYSTDFVTAECPVKPGWEGRRGEETLPRTSFHLASDGVLEASVQIPSLISSIVPLRRSPPCLPGTLKGSLELAVEMTDEESPDKWRRNLSCIYRC